MNCLFIYLKLVLFNMIYFYYYYKPSDILYWMHVYPSVSKCNIQFPIELKMSLASIERKSVSLSPLLCFNMKCMSFMAIYMLIGSINYTVQQWKYTRITTQSKLFSQLNRTQKKKIVFLYFLNPQKPVLFDKNCFLMFSHKIVDYLNMFDIYLKTKPKSFRKYRDQPLKRFT